MLTRNVLPLSHVFPYILPTFHRNLYHLYQQDGGWGTEGGTKYGYGILEADLFKASAFAEGNDVSESEHLSVAFACIVSYAFLMSRVSKRTRRCLLYIQQSIRN